jgi:hypothetical protein
MGVARAGKAGIKVARRGKPAFFETLLRIEAKVII